MNLKLGFPDRGQILCDIASMWNLRKWYKWTYLQNSNRVTDVENKPMVTRGDRGKDKLGEITTKNLLCSTGNSTQCSVTTYTGTNIIKSRYMYMYNWFTVMFESLKTVWSFSKN